MSIINKISAVAVTVMVAVAAEAQAPYSIYGFGTLDDNTLGVNGGMGGIGYAIDNNKQINPKNPASYAAMDSLTFLFDIGMNVESNWVKEGKLKETKTTANFDYAVLQFPMGKRFAASLGVMPFSSVNYNYSSKIDFGSYASAGSGGITQVYVGVAARIWKQLYFGTNVAFLFGNITHSTSIVPSSQFSVVAMLEQTQLHITDFRVELGLRYTQPINEKNSLTFGFVYSPQKKLLGKKTTEVYSFETSDESSMVSSGDTISLKNYYNIAASYGFGIGYKWNNRLILGLDVTYQPWSKANFLPIWLTGKRDDEKEGNLHDRLRLSIGGEYRHDPYARQYMRRMRYRLGAYFENSYLKVGTGYIRESGATIGLGFPLKQDRSIVNLSAQYFHRSLVPNSPIVENGVIISIGISFNEFWFFKNKIK
ncbi:MAG: hypothetical protein RR293_05020 [Bacteroidales bacterium]